MGKYEPKEMSPLERLRDQAHFWAYSGRDIKSQRRENNLAIAEECYKKSLTIYRQIADEYPSIRSKLDVYGTLEGYMDLCFRINTPDSMRRAKLLMEEALEVIGDCLKEAPHDKNLIHKQVDTLHMLGGICLEISGRHNLLAARRYFEQGIAICDAMATDTTDQTLWRQMAHGLEQFALINRMLYGAKSAETGKVCLEAAVKLRIRLFRKNFRDSAVSLAMTYAWLGDAYRDLGGDKNLKAAEHSYELAHRIWKVIYQPGGLVYYSIEYIQLLYRMAMLPSMEKDNAKQYLSLAIEIAEHISTAKGYEKWKIYSEMMKRLQDRF